MWLQQSVKTRERLFSLLEPLQTLLFVYYDHYYTISVISSYKYCHSISNPLLHLNMH